MSIYNRLPQPQDQPQETLTCADIMAQIDTLIMLVEAGCTEIKWEMHGIELTAMLFVTPDYMDNQVWIIYYDEIYGGYASGTRRDLYKYFAPVLEVS